MKYLLNQNNLDSMFEIGTVWEFLLGETTRYSRKVVSLTETSVSTIPFEGYDFSKMKKEEAELRKRPDEVGINLRKSLFTDLIQSKENKIFFYKE